MTTLPLLSGEKGGNSGERLPAGADVLEDFIAELSPLLMEILLCDCTKSSEGEQHNIFWATGDYEHLGAGYGYGDPIRTELITGDNGSVIMPRVLKNRAAQKERVRQRAEVFTPSWLCNRQNNRIDHAWFGREDVFNRETHDGTWESNPEKIVFPVGKSWRDYVYDRRMEITCGEAPYLVSRYDSTTGEEIPLVQRIGILDRKLRIVSENTNTRGEWLYWAKVSFKCVYGYEWQGDNLLIARENMLMTFADYYEARFGKFPQLRSLLSIARILSWNLWQMDGLKGVIPDSCREEEFAQLLLFGGEEPSKCLGCREGDITQHNGTYCLIRDWTAKKPKDKVRYIDLLTA